MSLDREAGLIQVQYEDGKLGELDLADWRHTMQEKVGSPYEYMTSVDDDEA